MTGTLKQARRLSRSGTDRGRAPQAAAGGNAAASMEPRALVKFDGRPREDDEQGVSATKPPRIAAAFPVRQRVFNDPAASPHSGVLRILHRFPVPSAALHTVAVGRPRLTARFSGAGRFPSIAVTAISFPTSICRGMVIV